MCFIRQIRVAGALLQCAAEAIIDMPALVIYPAWEVLVFLVIAFGFVFGALLLASSGEDSTNLVYGYHEFKYDSQTQQMFVYWLFGFFWIAEFCSSVGFMVVAFCFALWFFAPMKKPTEPTEEDIDPSPSEEEPTEEEEGPARELTRWPIMTGLKLTVCHHLGTVAFGSLIIAVIQMLRIALEYIEKQKRMMTGGTDEPNPLWKFVFCCLRCCLWCLEKCMKALNKIAYIVTVVNGTSFCSSACHAMELLVANISWFAIVSGISTCMLLFGKFACALITAGLCGWWCTYLDVSSILFPTLCCLIIAYIIAALFAEVYEMGVDTMLVCFLEIEDKECDGDKISAPPQLHDEIIIVQADEHVKIAQEAAVKQAIEDFKKKQAEERKNRSGGESSGVANTTAIEKPPDMQPGLAPIPPGPG